MRISDEDYGHVETVLQAVVDHALDELGDSYTTESMYAPFYRFMREAVNIVLDGTSKGVTGFDERVVRSAECLREAFIQH